MGKNWRHSKKEGEKNKKKWALFLKRVTSQKNQGVEFGFVQEKRNLIILEREKEEERVKSEILENEVIFVNCNL